MGKIENVFGAFVHAFDIFSSDPHGLGVLFSARSDLNALYYDCVSKQYYEVTPWSDVKNAKQDLLRLSTCDTIEMDW